MDKVELIKDLVPINSLNHSRIAALAASAIFEQLPMDTCLFVQGQKDNEAIYLLSGEVLLTTGDSSRNRLVVGGTDTARFAMAQLKPRKYTGRAKTAVLIARIDSLLLDRFVTWEQATSYEVSEVGTAQDSEWMQTLMKGKTFQKLPPSNFSALVDRFEAIWVKAGQVVIRQGAPADYYYAIKSGHAEVLRKSEATQKVEVVDSIREGEDFGEDALLTGNPRNASVVMVTDGILMRLSPKDFDELLREPMVKWVTLEEAKTMARNGAGLIDVRLEEEYLSGTIRGSLNMPLCLLRKRVGELDPHRRYVIFCQTGSRSCVAAFILTQRGFDVSVLQGGLDTVPRIA